MLAPFLVILVAVAVCVCACVCVCKAFFLLEEFQLNRNNLLFLIFPSVINAIILKHFLQCEAMSKSVKSGFGEGYYKYPFFYYHSKLKEELLEVRLACLNDFM